MNPFKKNTITVPRNLEAATHYDASLEANPAGAGISSGDVEAIWQTVCALYRTGTQPAIALSIRRHGKLILNRAIGYARGGGPSDPPGSRKVPATPETPFCLFSASKAITAMLVHKLAEQGRLHLDNPVADYLPEFAANGKGAVTIAQMLSHHGGIPLMPETRSLVSTLYDWNRTITRICEARPRAGIGRVQAYHDLTSGYVLGEIIQRVTGGTLRDYMAETIQRPLGFRYGNYGVPQEQATEVARNYMTGPPPPFLVDVLAKRALGTSFEKAVEVSNNAAFLRAVIPSGNIMASAEEYCRFFQMLLNGGELDGKRLFEPETVRRAIQPRDKRQFDRILILPFRFSAGLLLGDDPLGLYGPGCGQAYGHPGFINILGWADPRRALSVALLTNGKAALTPHLLPLAQLLWRIGRHSPPIAGRLTAAHTARI